MHTRMMRTSLACPLCGVMLMDARASHICKNAKAKLLDDIPITSMADATRDSEGNTSVVFNMHVDELESEREGLSMAMGAEAREQWQVGTRVRTAVALANPDKSEIPAGEVGRVWEVTEEGFIMVHLDFKPDDATMKGSFVKAEPSDLLHERWLPKGEKVLCLPLITDLNNHEVEVSRGTPGVIVGVVPKRAGYKVKMTVNGITGVGCVPAYLVQPSIPPAPKALKGKRSSFINALMRKCSSLARARNDKDAETRPSSAASCTYDSELSSEVSSSCLSLVSSPSGLRPALKSRSRVNTITTVHPFDQGELLSTVVVSVPLPSCKV
eukprot:TRINITY_DN23301_c0_g1_i1.p1 TRINITY_DN23301_c0_g1~~TRINITY_DN23301_c0_g1_i1.p1  ORF type:complete len:325 (+),score=54.99 TRINITY_DN23301_c0_g1_i1:42-1016(+)